MTDTHTKHPRVLEEDARAVFMLGGRIWVRNPCRPLSAAGKGKGCADTQFVSPRTVSNIRSETGRDTMPREALHDVALITCWRSHRFLHGKGWESVKGVRRITMPHLQEYPRITSSVPVQLNLSNSVQTLSWSTLRVARRPSLSPELLWL